MGYVWAVGGATLTFLTMTGIFGWFHGLAGESLGSVEFLEYAIRMCVFGIFYFTSTSVQILVPFLSVMLVARRYRIQSALYFALAGSLTGLVFTPVLLWWKPPLFWIGADTLTFRQQFEQTYLWVTASGFMGGLGLWWRAGRRLNGPDEPSV
jgi:hypothetical protein